MTIEDIDRMEFAKNNVPSKWNFLGKTKADLEPMCFGAYQKVSDLGGIPVSEPGLCKIVYGGEQRARAAVAELANLGIAAEAHPPEGEYGKLWHVFFYLPAGGQQ